MHSDRDLAAGRGAAFADQSTHTNPRGTPDTPGGTHASGDQPGRSDNTAINLPDQDEFGGIYNRAITVLIADDHALVREGTRRLLEAEPDIEVVAEAGDGETAVALALETHPDVIIMDIAMPPGISGIEATRRIKEKEPTIAVLAVTAYNDVQYVMALLKVGAAGFLLKDVRGVELIRAVRAVARGEPVLQANIAIAAIKDAVNHAVPANAAPPPLSEREMQVLQEAARGLPNKDIARRMNLSVRTVHTHLGNIFAKLGVGSRTEAVLLALRRNWVSLHDTSQPEERETGAADASAPESVSVAVPAESHDESHGEEQESEHAPE